MSAGSRARGPSTHEMPPSWPAASYGPYYAPSYGGAPHPRPADPAMGGPPPPPFRTPSVRAMTGDMPGSGDPSTGTEIQAAPSHVQYSYAGPDPYYSGAYTPYHVYSYPSWTDMRSDMGPEQKQYVAHQYYYTTGMWPAGYVAPPPTAMPAPPATAAAAAAAGSGAAPPFRTDTISASAMPPPPAMATTASASSSSKSLAVHSDSAHSTHSARSAAGKSDSGGAVSTGSATSAGSKAAAPGPPDKYLPPTPITKKAQDAKKLRSHEHHGGDRSHRKKRERDTHGKKKVEETEEEAEERKLEEASRFASKDTQKFKRRGVRNTSGAPLSLAMGRTPTGAPARAMSATGGESPAETIPSHLHLITAKETAKSKKTKAFLFRALKKEVLFQDINESTLKDIADVMYAVNCKKGDNIITQGEYGDAWFVVEHGTFLVIHQETPSMPPKVVGECSAGDSFGEGSLLFSVPRAATLKAKDEARVWTLDAKKFIELRATMSKTMAEKSGKMVKFLMKIDFFSRIFTKDEDLEEIAAALYAKKYKKGDTIVNQGDPSEEFFIIRHGTVEVYIKDLVTGEKKMVTEMKQMQSFGERGLISGKKRAATIVASSTHVKCYVMNRSDFINLLAKPMSSEFQAEMRRQDEENLDKEVRIQFLSLVKCKLEEFEYIGVLGVGSFGRVSLVQDPTTKETYSLKKIRKNKVIETNQEEHVRNERSVLANLDSDFCCRLYATYQDRLNIYFLLEPVLGGELFTVLRWNQKFSEKTARFYAACTILAFEHLHSKNLIYRDLKPENLLISANGYCKLVDFGFAKRRNKSCTLCGTPEYLAPEVIQGYPQGFGVDWWELGIFIYEMVIGNAPFQDDPHMKMYEKILTIPPEFPSKSRLSGRVVDLINRLLIKEAHSRLGSGRGGAEQVKSHAWFSSLDWKDMLRQEIRPPYKPKIDGATDVSCFEYYEEEDIDEDLLPDPEDTIYKWCEDF